MFSLLFAILTFNNFTEEVSDIWKFDINRGIKKNIHYEYIDPSTMQVKQYDYQYFDECYFSLSVGDSYSITMKGNGKSEMDCYYYAPDRAPPAFTRILKFQNNKKTDVCEFSNVADESGIYRVVFTNNGPVYNKYNIKFLINSENNPKLKCQDHMEL